MWRSIVVVVLALAIGACDSGGTPAAAPSSAAVRPAPGTHELGFDFGGVRRTYLLHAPPGYDPATPLPLVVVLHFYPGTGRDMQRMVGLDALADRENFVVAYPDGYGAAFNALICCGTQDDVGFLKALVEQVRTQWNADPARTYATGISNGGDMSFRLAVEASDVFAAVGVISGGFGGEAAARADYAPTRPVSVLTIIGKRDRYFPLMQQGLTTWRQRLRCSTARSQTARVYTRTVTRCADGSEVDAYVLPDMGHTWPGAQTGTLAAPDAGLNATDVLWKFFKAQPR